MAKKARKIQSGRGLAVCVVSETAINEQLNRSYLRIDAGVQTDYAEGVIAALRWVTGDEDEAPFPDALDEEEDF